jgi:TRAP-type uncharacterized transport system substrate-binding protein
MQCSEFSWIRIYAFLGCALSALAIAPISRAAKPIAPEPIQLSIGGGTIDSTAFRWSSALAQVLSRPPGLPDCLPAGPCGVPGVVAGAQTYDDGQATMRALLDGLIATAVIPAQRIYRARCDLKPGENSLLSVLKVLYRQPVQILARTDLAANWPKSLAGKTLAIGESGSDAEAFALAFVEAYGLSHTKIKLIHSSAISSIAALKGGTAVAAIFLGHTLDVPISDLIGRGFTLVSLADSPERHRLLEALPAFEASAIPPDTYPGLPAISILAQPVVWAAGPGLGEPLAEKLIATVSEPHNLARLSDLVAPAVPVPEGAAFLRLPAPPTEASVKFAQAANLPTETLGCVVHGPVGVSPNPKPRKRS